MVQAKAETERLLLVVDESPGSKRAVAYTANILGRRRGFRIYLLHLLPPLPAELLEFGGAEDPRKERRLEAELRRDQGEWIASAKASAEPTIEGAARALHKAGIADRNIDRQLSYPTEPRDVARYVIRLEPLSRFPVIRDLAVDRGVLFENLKRVKAWVPLDGTYDLGPGPKMDPGTQEKMYPLSRCISCCLCLEVCPQVTIATGFVGAAIINQVRLFNEHPTGKGLKTERLHAMMGDGGIHECAYAQNCVQICPKGIPLTTSISIVYGQAMRQAIKDLFQNPETAQEGEPGHRRPVR